MKRKRILPVTEVDTAKPRGRNSGEVFASVEN